MPYPRYPTRTYARLPPPSQVIWFPPKAPTLQSFSATLFDSGSAFDPSTITGLKLWLKADSLALSDGTAMGSSAAPWTDSSATAYHLDSGGATYKTNIVNGKAIVRFNGTTDFLRRSGTPDIAVSQPDTVFIVGNQTSKATQARFFHSFTDNQIVVLDTNGFMVVYAGAALSATTDLSGAFHISTTVFNGASSVVYVDGTLHIGPSNPGSNPVGAINLGVDTSGHWLTGDIAEVLLYNSALSSTDRGNVETYLKNKYAIAGGTSAPAATLSVKALKAFAATLSRSAALIRKITDAGFTAALSFVGDFVKNFISGGVLYYQSFTATLFGGGLSFTDNFNRADGSLGSNWTTDSTTSALTIVSNTCKGSTAGDDNVGTYNTSLAADQYAQFKVTTTGGYLGVVLRSDNAGNFYTCYYPPSGNVTLYRFSGGSGSAMVTGSSITPAVNDIVYFEAVGTSLTMKVNGVTVATGTDGAYTGAGYAGINFYSDIAAVDDFQAGAIGGGGAVAATLTKRTGKALSATWSPVAALAKKLGKALSATLSFVGTLTKRSTRFLSATLSFVGNLATNLIHGGTLFTQNLAATLSFVGAFNAKQILTRAFTATLSFTGASSRRAGKALTATLSSSATLVKRIVDAGFTATLSFIGAIAKRITDAGFTATLAFTGFLAASKSFLKSLTASLSFIGAMTPKQILTRVFTATLNATATLQRSTGKALSATLSTATSLVRRVSHAFSAIVISAGSLVKAIRDAGFTATLSFVGNLTTAAVHFFTRSFTATLSFVGNLSRTRLIARVFAATLSFTGTIRRRTGKVFAASLAFSAAIRRAIRKGFSAALSFIGFLFRGGAVTIIAGVITRCLALIGISGSSAKIVRAGSQLSVVKVDETGAKIQVTGSTLTVTRTK